MFSSLEALRSFCLFATVCNLMLWLATMTIFLSLVVFDTRRVEHKRKECWGAFFCSEDSVICCKSKLTSGKQREFVKKAPAEIEAKVEVVVPRPAACAHEADHTEIEISQ